MTVAENPFPVGKTACDKRASYGFFYIFYQIRYYLVILNFTRLLSDRWFPVNIDNIFINRTQAC